MTQLHLRMPTDRPHAQSSDPTAELLQSVPPTACSEPASLVAAPRAAAAFRLGLQHTLRSRRLVFGCMAAATVLPLLGLLGLTWPSLITALLLPTYALLSAIDGDGRSERFWQALGAPALPRELGRVFLDLLVLHGLSGLAWMCAADEVCELAVVHSWALAAVLYGLAGLTRGLVSRPYARIAATVALGLSILPTALLPHLFLRMVTIVEVVVIQAAAVATLGVVARLLLAGRWSAASSARRRGAPAWFLGPVLALVPLPYAAGTSLPVDISWSSIHDESMGRVGTSSLGYPLGSASLLRRDEDGSIERLPVRGSFLPLAASHRSGAVAYVRIDDASVRSQWAASAAHLSSSFPASAIVDEYFRGGVARAVRTLRDPSLHVRAPLESSTQSAQGTGQVPPVELQLGLVTPDRGVHECTGPSPVRWTWFDESGEGMTSLLEDGSLWRIDRNHCGPTDTSPTGLPARLQGHPKLSTTDDWRVLELAGGSLIHLN